MNQSNAQKVSKSMLRKLLPTAPHALLCDLLGLLVVLAGVDLLVARLAQLLGWGAFALGFVFLAVGMSVEIPRSRGAAGPARQTTRLWPWGGAVLAVASWLLAKFFWSFVWEGLLFTVVLLVIWIGTWWCLGAIASARRARRMPVSWVGIALTVLLLVGWGFSWWLLYDRHGLPDEVPLPAGVVYQSADPWMIDDCSFPPPCRQVTIGTVWRWTSSDPPALIQQFYLSQLHADHQWAYVSLLVGEPGVGAINLRTGKGLSVLMDTSVSAIRAPPGGSVISIIYYSGTTITH